MLEFITIVNGIILVANILILWIVVKLYTEILKNMLAGKRRQKDTDRIDRLEGKGE